MRVRPPNTKSFHHGLRLISKFTTSQPEKQTIAIYILSNISWSKGSQTMKFGQSVNRIRKIFLGEFIPRPFSKKSKNSRLCRLYVDYLMLIFPTVECNIITKYSLRSSINFCTVPTLSLTDFTACTVTNNYTKWKLRPSAMLF